MAEESFGDRTEQATPRKREEAAKKGQVARSREIPSVMVLMSGLMVLSLFGSYVFQQCYALVAQGLAQIGSISLHPSNVNMLYQSLLVSLLLIVAPVFVGLSGVAILSHVLQGGTAFSSERLKLDLSRISLVSGIKRFFSKQSVAELLKSLLKLLIVGGAAFSTIRKELVHIVPLLGQDLTTIFQYVTSVSFSLCLKTILVMMLLAGLDYLFQRWTFEKGLRMTKQEIKEEMKSTEGDPQVKSRIRSIQRELARRRMMAEVPKADVIITNPVHLAVALYYKSREMAAPKVTAKGAGHIAEKIKEVGRAHGVPIIENRPLAQALYKWVSIGETIPSTLYHVVADILAYVYRIKRKVV